MTLNPGIKTYLKAWWRASRPPFFIATLMPLTLGLVASVKAAGQYQWGTFTLILLACFMVHTATNIANDLFDHWAGVDSGPSIGGSRVLQEGLLSTKALGLALGFLYLASFVLALVIINRSGQSFLWVLVIFAALSSFFYVAPPFKYGRRGLGEVFVFLNMGLIMTAGTYLALTRSFTPSILCLALPIAFMVAGILYYQSLPEIETDRAAGKHTLAVKLGPVRAVFLFRLWWPGVWLLMLNLWAAGLVSWPVALGLLSAPLYFKTVRLLEAVQDWPALDKHGHLVRKLYFINSLALILGLAFN